MNYYVRAIAALSKLCGGISIILIAVSIAIVCQAIFVRTVLDQSTIWQTEFVTFSLIAATFIGSPYVLLTHGHVNVDIVPLYASHRLRMILALTAAIIAMSFCAILFWYSLDWWYEAYRGGFRTSSIWRARLWIPYASLPIGSGLLVLQYLADIYALVSGQALPFFLMPE